MIAHEAFELVGALDLFERIVAQALRHILGSLKHAHQQFELGQAVGLAVVTYSRHQPVGQPLDEEIRLFCIGFKQLAVDNKDRFGLVGLDVAVRSACAPQHEDFFGGDYAICRRNPGHPLGSAGFERLDAGCPIDSHGVGTASCVDVSGDRFARTRSRVKIDIEDARGSGELQFPGIALLDIKPGIAELVSKLGGCCADYPFEPRHHFELRIARGSPDGLA